MAKQVPFLVVRWMILKCAHPVTRLLQMERKAKVVWPRYAYLTDNEKYFYFLVMFQAEPLLDLPKRWLIYRISNTDKPLMDYVGLYEKDRAKAMARLKDQMELLV